MTTNQPEFTIAELGAKFGAQLGQIYSELITLEKVIESQQAQITSMTKNEVSLVDHIQDLEAEISKFKEQEVDDLYTLSEEAAKIAAEGSAIINDKAAP